MQAFPDGVLGDGTGAGDGEGRGTGGGFTHVPDAMPGIGAMKAPGIVMFRALVACNICPTTDFVEHEYVSVVTPERDRLTTNDTAFEDASPRH